MVVQLECYYFDIIDLNPHLIPGIFNYLLEKQRHKLVKDTSIIPLENVKSKKKLKTKSCGVI